MIHEIAAKSVLRKHKKTDSWFVARYSMNLYRGCVHNCAYCDGRAEGYYVEGEFGSDVGVKTNAPEILKRELDPARKRKPMPKGFFMIGGGVGDSYQPAERKYGLTRSVLEMMLERRLPVSLLTKSSLVERDRELIGKINRASRAVVSFSLSTADDAVSAVFEPGVSRPTERLEILRRFSGDGIPCGVFLMPVIPFVTDSEEMIGETVLRAKEAGAAYVVFGGMTLKDGRQKDYFLDILKRYDPDLPDRIAEIYRGDPYGAATGDYYRSIENRFIGLAKNHGMPVRMPESVWGGVVEPNDRPLILLEHLDYLLKSSGKPSRYGYIAYRISKLETGRKWTDAFRYRLDEEKTVREIFETGYSPLLDSLKWWGE